MSTRRTLSTVAVAITVALGLTACGSDGGNSIAQQAKAGDDKNYISGDGGVEQVAVAQRGKPVRLTGKLLDGTPWSSAQDAAGKMVVVNVWGSWCPPCKAEMPALEKAWKSFQPKGDVVMIGVDRIESPQTAAAYLKTAGVTYPSLQDDGGAALVALQGKAAATPSTLVLDRQHRIAARVSGPTTTATLTGLVKDVAGKS